MTLPAPVRRLDLGLPSAVEEVADERLAAAGIRLLLKRDDLISAEIPGNKWRKLKYNLERAACQGHGTLLTFGGAYSNHIRATAAAGYYFGFETIGIIRGEEHLPLNDSLSYAVSRGMRLHYLDRSAYRRSGAADVIASLRDQYGSFYLLPEGGSNAAAVRGCAEIPAEITGRFDLICCACGTGGTLAGVAAGLPEGRRALGFSVLRGGQFLTGRVAELQRQATGSVSRNWSVEHDFHFGGFARGTRELDEFIADFGDRHGVTLDRVYTGKMMYGLYALASAGRFPPGTTIVALITG